MADFITKTECELNTKMMSKDIEQLNTAVQKVVEKVEHLNVKVERQDITMSKLEQIVDKLVNSVDKFADVLNKVDKETAINTNNIKWDWKMILASGTVITFLVGVIMQGFGG